MSDMMKAVIEGLQKDKKVTFVNVTGNYIAIGLINGESYHIKVSEITE